VFPYDISDASGALRFSNDGVLLDALSGRHGSARITVNGRVNDSSRYAGFEIDARGENVSLDHDLYAALPESYQGLWRDAAPVGLSDIHAVIRRAQGSPEVGRHDPHVRIDTRLLSGSVSYEGRRLTQADGLIRIQEGELELHDFHAWLDDGELRASGTVSNSGGGDSRESDVVIEASNLDLTRAESSDPGAVDAHIRFEGRGDVWGRVVRAADSGSPAYVIRLTGGSLMGFDAGEAWQVDRGWVHRGEVLQDVMDLRAHRGAAELHLQGQLPVESNPALPMSLSIQCGRGDIATLLRTLVPPRWVAVRDALGLAGSGGVEIQFDRERQSDGSMRSEALIDLRAERMKPTPIPLDLREIAGRVRVSDEGFSVEDVQARYGAAGRFGVSGVGGWESGNTWSRIDVDVRDIDLTPDCVDAMPGALSKLLKRMAASGRINTNLGRLRLESRGAEHWDINGQLGFSDAFLDLGLPVEEFQGTLSGSFQVRPGQLVTLDADFAIDEGRLGGRAIREWEGRIERAAGETGVRLEGIHGRIHNGEVNGEASIDPETGAYELSITLHELNFAALMSGTDAEQADPETSGVVSGHVFVRGQGGDVATRAGGGELRIMGASLLHSRVTASVVEAERAAKHPVGATIEQAELRFAWDGNLLRFNRVDLHTPARRLIGEGSWNTDSGAISFNLIGASREDALRLPVLTDLLELAGNELVQYRIIGTSDNPKTSIEPLHALTDPVKRLLRGG
jgi:hypothetical protein